MREVERQITLAQLDRGWEEHLQRVAELREGIHLVRIGGLRPLEQFARRVVGEFDRLQEEIDRRIVESFERIEVTADGVDLNKDGLRGPSSTWTYLTNDRGAGSLHEMLAGSFVFDPISSLITGPLMGAVALWRRRRRRK